MRFLTTGFSRCLALSFLALLASCATFREARLESPYVADVATRFEAVHKAMKPLGVIKTDSPAVKVEGLRGKVFAGYQGWFMPKGDGSGVDWMHYGASSRGSRSQRVFEPGSAVVDYWPSMREAGPTERYPTPFVHVDGRVAEVYSALHPDTVDRHFKWMAEYDVDGAFCQRFGTALRTPERYSSRNIVLDNARRSARKHGQSYAVMYDLSGLRLGEIQSLVMEDWKRLRKRMRVTEEANYMTLNGKPLVSVWGVGFSDSKRQYTVEECEALIDFLKNDPEYGGCSVMLGVPYRWREGIRDAIDSEKLHPVLEKADVISPWSVGRYRSVAQAREQREKYYLADFEWCESRGIEYLPVAFPGFSWGNLERSRGREAVYDLIPREEGRFLWAQADTIARSGIETVYIAMFDEIDEGTCIFKVSQDPPVGESQFLHYEGLEDDHYLWLASRIRQRLNAKNWDEWEMPSRSPVGPN